MTGRVAVTGVGLATPVGHDTVSTAAALAAGVGRFDEIESYVTAGGSTVTGSPAHGLTDGLSGSDRLLALAVPAAREALFAAEEFYDPLDLSRAQLLLALAPAERPTLGALDDDALAILLERSEAEALAPRAQCLREGHAGGLAALRRACELLQSGEVHACVLGGVDSLLDRDTLKWLERSKRLKSDERPQGLVPGEAAGFLVLELEDRARERGAPALATVRGSGAALEPAAVGTGAPLRGKGLAESIQKARAESGDPALAGLLCDLNGEYYRMKEWSLAAMRAFEGAGAIPDLHHPAEGIGDVGAASGPVLLGLATTWLQPAFAPRAADWLVFAGSDAGARESAVLAPPEVG